MRDGARDGTFKTSDGSTIAYTLHAGGADDHRIALIHSLALDRGFWGGVVPFLTPHASVLTYDCRGHGRSDRRAASFTTEQFARDLAQLLDHVTWPTAAVAGASMGGCVAQAFAGLYPPRTSALGLIDTTAWYGEQAPREWRERADTARAKGLAGLLDFQVTRWFGERFRAEHPETVTATAAVFAANDIECYAASCAMLGAADLRPYLPSLDMPVSIIVGEEDYATPLAMAQQLRVALPHATLTVLPGARHLTPIECPELIASHLLTLLRRR